VAKADLDQLHKRLRDAAENLLSDEEEVITVFPGKSKQALILTDRRVLIVKAGAMAGATLRVKGSSFEFEDIGAVNVYNGPRLTAIELVKKGEDPPKRPDLRAAYQWTNWLPCDKEIGSGARVAELRAFIDSGGRSRSARAALEA
jgi:hypothetical protein